MNLNSLFPIQADLDKRIIEEHNLLGQNLLKKKCVAFICELYETANEARFFKFWSKNQQANIEHYNVTTLKDGQGNVMEEIKEPIGLGNPLLEEYVDTIHFALSIANDIGYVSHKYNDPGFLDLSNSILGLTQLITVLPYTKNNNIGLIFDYLIHLGYSFGFDEETVIQAYFAKNKTNHERQESGY